MAKKIPPPPPVDMNDALPEVVVTAKRDFSGQAVPLLPINEPRQPVSRTAYNYGGGGVMDSPMLWLLIAGAVGVAAMFYVRD